jgi:hypothetical protein
MTMKHFYSEDNEGIVVTFNDMTLRVMKSLHT